MRNALEKPELDPVTRELRREYRGFILETTINLLRRYYCPAMLLILVIFTAIDFVAGRPHARYFFFIRGAMAISVGALWAALLFPAARKHAKGLSLVLAAILVVGIELMIYHLGPTASVYYGLCLILLGTVGFPWSYWNSLGFAVFTFLVFLIPAVSTVDPVNVPILLNNLAFLGATAVMVVIIAAVAEKRRFLDYRLRHQLAMSLDKARTFDRLKTQFFSNVSHELRTPLTLMLSPMEELLDNPRYELNAEARQYLGLMQRNGKRLLNLINGLLDLSKLEAGKFVLNVGANSLARLLHDVHSRFEPHAARRSIKLTLETGEGVPDTAFDLERIELVLHNFISNAIKFTPPGGRVSLRLRHSDRWQVVEIEDTGIGIKPEDQSKVFDRFAQADSSVTRRYGGTGIGLSLAKDLIELHGGRVELSSTPGKGSCFSFRIPQRNAEPATSGVEAPEKRLEVIPDWVEGGENSAQPAHSFQASANGARSATVLVIDDNADLRTLLTSLLAPHYNVLSARSGDEGIALARQKLPDLVISDIMMPGMSGYEVARALKSDPMTKYTAVILLTARLDNQSLVQGLAAGADDYLRKPFASSELLARVRSQLRLRELTLLSIKTANRSMLGELAGGVAHEVNNPLAIIAMSADHVADLAGQLEDRNAAAKLHKLSSTIKVTVDRVAKIVTGLRSLVFNDKADERELVNVRSILEDIALLSKAKAYAAGATVEVAVSSEELNIECNAPELRQAILNITLNAIEAVERSERKLVRLVARQSNDRIIIEINDTGVGIPKELEQKIFLPFFTTKGVGKGVGMGLATALRIVEAHQGTISVQPTSGLTTFAVSLPRISWSHT